MRDWFTSTTFKFQITRISRNFSTSRCLPAVKARSQTWTSLIRPWPLPAKPSLALGTCRSFSKNVRFSSFYRFLDATNDHVRVHIDINRLLKNKIPTVDEQLFYSNCQNSRALIVSKLFTKWVQTMKMTDVTRELSQQKIKPISLVLFHVINCKIQIDGSFQWSILFFTITVQILARWLARSYCL